MMPGAWKLGKGRPVFGRAVKCMVASHQILNPLVWSKEVSGELPGTGANCAAAFFHSRCTAREEAKKNNCRAREVGN